MCPMAICQHVLNAVLPNRGKYYIAMVKTRVHLCVCVGGGGGGGFPGCAVVSTVCCHSKSWWFKSRQGLKEKKKTCMPSLQHLHHTSHPAVMGIPSMYGVQIHWPCLIGQLRVQVGLRVSTPTN